MVALKKSLVINAPAERVFAYVTEPTTMPDWFPGGVEARNVVGSGEGQQYEWTHKYVGILLRGQTTVVEHVPNKHSVHQSIGTIRSVWKFSVEPHEEGTTLTIEIEYDIPVPVLGKLVERAVVGRDARDLEMGLINVKETLLG
ncbi:MAG: SRPBCC family protein [Deltaproteobacteria bacterium]|nr:SRPBCC family protein [Deltaproteobacteria bacterium]MBW2381325.1 SRPBCC family protein [Deltaproteobacteria bacterium]MBW2552034.1 SRPBCC family protein [Deltaproteobacteria bacterium]